MELLSKIKTLPVSPGCYIYKNADGEVLYVGKSKSLRYRVRQYFQKNRPKKIERLVKAIADLDYICVETEIEALLLEHRLIKHYRPPFNAKMKKDRQPPYIHIDTHHAFPGLSVAFGTAPDKMCFGHFYSQDDAADVLTLINSVWHTPLCGQPHFDSPNGRPCLNYHMGKCVAPCSREIDDLSYQQLIQDVCAFLRGNSKQVMRVLKHDMLQAADNLLFEKAARLRDRYNGLAALSRRLEKTCANLSGRRYCVLIKGFNEDAFLLLYIENGKTCLQARFTSADDWTAAKRFEFVSQICARNRYPDADARMTKAILEVSAHKRFIDITRIRKEAVILHKLDKEFPRFYKEGRRKIH